MYLSILALFTTPRERRWSDRRDLNSQQPAWKAGALPIELLPHMTGEGGLEPPTTCPKQLEKNCGLRHLRRIKITPLYH